MKWLLFHLHIPCTYLRIGLNVWWFAPCLLYNISPYVAAKFAQFFDLYDYKMAERNNEVVFINIPGERDTS